MLLYWGQVFLLHFFYTGECFLPQTVEKVQKKDLTPQSVSQATARTPEIRLRAASRSVGLRNAPAIVDPDPLIPAHAAPFSYKRVFNACSCGNFAKIGSSKSLINSVA